MESHSSYVTVRCKDIIYKVQKAPYETDDKAYDRAWYIATRLSGESDWMAKESLSHIWANDKYFGMKYSK